MNINEKKDYIILDDFKGNYAIAKYEVEDFKKRETNNYVGVIDKDLNEVLPFKPRSEGWETHCSNARIEDGEWVEDETRYYYIEEIYRYISDGVYLDLKEEKLIDLNNKLHLDTLEFEKINEIPKSQKIENETIKYYYSYEKELSSISLNNININIEYLDDYICFSTGKRKKKYSIKGYNKHTIKKFALPSGEYIFFPRIDSDNWNSNVVILNKDLEEILNTDMFSDYIYIKTNVANTNCFEIVDVFSSPNEDISPSSATSYIYDENFKFIGEFGNYTRVNIHEILSDNRIFNLITKEVRDYSPNVIKNENMDDNCIEFEGIDDDYDMYF